MRTDRRSSAAPVELIEGFDLDEGAPAATSTTVTTRPNRERRSASDQLATVSETDDGFIRPWTVLALLPLAVLLAATTYTTVFSKRRSDAPAVTAPDALPDPSHWRP